jgi:nucleoside-diphosphate-sugar epimerase
MKVFVTGATGFVGRHTLGPLLSAGHEVHALSRAESSTQGVRWHRGDLLSGDAVTVVRAVRPDVVLHLAWYAVHGKFWTARENLSWLARSVDLLEVFSEMKGQRFIGAGTCAEYDWSKLDGPCQEDETPIGPATLYGATKDSLRRTLRAAAREAGFSWAWGRLFFLLGPNEQPGRFVPSVARALVEGRPAEMSHGQQVRDFMHVEDAGRAFATLVTSSVQGAVNVASGEGHTLAALAQTLAAKAGRPELLSLGARPAQPNEPATLLADVSRLRGCGFSARRTLDSGLDEALDEARLTNAAAARPA